MQTITNNGLTIALDAGSLAASAKRMEQIFYESDNIRKNSRTITISEYQKEIDRLVKLALNIINGTLGANIWDYLPYTKTGKFSKTGNVLLATSGITDVWNSDFFSLKTMDLQLVPVSYDQKTDPSTIKVPEDILKPMSGDGTTLYIELGYYSRNKKAEPIFDENGTPRRIEKTRNSYLKEDEIRPGCVYTDAKGNDFLYLGHLWMDKSSSGNRSDNTVYTDRQSYLNSRKRKETLEYRANRHPDMGKGYFMYMKMTKKNEELIKSSQNIGELLKTLIRAEFWDCIKKFKHLQHPMKVTAGKGQVIDPDLGDGFIYTSHKYDTGDTYDDFFYFEEVV